MTGGLIRFQLPWRILRQLPDGESEAVVGKQRVFSTASSSNRRLVSVNVLHLRHHTYGCTGKQPHRTHMQVGEH